MAIGDKEGPIPGRTPGDSTVHTVSAKNIMRGQLETDVEQFLANGGVIESVAHYVRSESMDEPKTSFGSTPGQ